MFIRSLDEKEIENESMKALGVEVKNKIFPQTAEGQSMRWSKFKDKDAREIFEVIGQKVFPFIKSINNKKTSAFSRYMEDAMFLIPTPQVLQKIITGLDELYEYDIKDLDMQGDLYEYMLSKLSVAGQNGQFRTPKHIRNLMVSLLAPTPDDRICDPACGTAGFLVSSAEYIRQKYAMDPRLQAFLVLVPLALFTLGGVALFHYYYGVQRRAAVLLGALLALLSPMWRHFPFDRIF